MDALQPNSTLVDLVVILRRTEEIVVSTLTHRVRRLGASPKTKSHGSTSKVVHVVFKKKRHLPNVLWKYVKAEAKANYRKKILSYDEMEKDAKISKRLNDYDKPSSKGKAKSRNKGSKRYQ